MASPTVYKWTDPGAPQLTRGDLNSYQALYQAVLIDGYGSMTPPGSGLNKWTIPFSDATGFILKQGGTPARKCCIKIYELYSAGHYAKMHCAADFTDMSTPVDMWAGGSDSDRVGMGYSNNNNYKIPWIIIATERAMYCQFGYNIYNDNSFIFDTNSSNDDMNNYHWFFGDYVKEDEDLTVNQCVSFTDYTGTGVQYCQSLTYSSSEGYGKKRCAGNAGNVTGEFNCIPFYNRPIGSGNPHVGGYRTRTGTEPRYPNMVNGGLYLDKVKILSAGNIMGEFPGLLFPIQDKPFPPNGIIYEINGTGDYLGETIYVFCTEDGQYMVRDGEWGVE